MFEGSDNILSGRRSDRSHSTDVDLVFHVVLSKDPLGTIEGERLEKVHMKHLTLGYTVTYELSQCSTAIKNSMKPNI